ncbi:MAG: tetratricopeptide repeat protein [Tannerella sp.]|jgi:tetratricopeptide (TPR) repeat protein|nr:tetratricopeptide repeat protein [Tannerella sp.]
MKIMRNISRKIIGLFMLCGLYIHVSAQEADIKAAETAYASESYEQAIELYESVIKNYGDSFELYYNLGNAYYKTGKIARAILNYERALLIKPGDGDIRFNLEMARQQTVDKIEPLEEFFLNTWFRSVQNLISVDSWATAGIVCFVMFIFCLVLYFFSKWMRLKKLGFYLGLLLFAGVIFANIFAYNQKKELINRNGAIVFTPTVTVKSSPDNSGTDLFVLHEGTKVFIRSAVGDWIEIVFENGNVGWINKKDITVI